MEFKSVDAVKKYASMSGLMLLPLTLVPIDCYGAKTTASFYSDASYTDNARLSSSSTIEDVIQKVGLNFSILEERKRFNADANFNLSQDYYFNKTYSDQTQLTTGFGLFNFDIVEEFLDWRTSFTRTQVFSSSLAVDTPDNREVRNTFRTGPSINYRINSVSNFVLSSNYVQVENSSESSSDTKRGDISASYNYSMNSLTSFNLGGNYDRVFKNSSDKEGDDSSEPVTKGLNIGMKRLFPHGSMNISVGTSESDGGDQETVKSNSLNLNIERSEVFSHHMSISASRNISDTSIGFDSAESTNESPGQVEIYNQSGLDFVTRTTLNFNLSRSIDLYQYQLGASWNDTDYNIQEGDERNTGFTLSLRSRPEDGVNLGLKIQTSFIKPIDFRDQGEALTQTYTLDGQYQWIRDLGFNAHVAYKRRGHNKNYSLEYEEFSAGIGLTWKLL